MKYTIQFWLELNNAPGHPKNNHKSPRAESDEQMKIENYPTHVSTVRIRNRSQQKYVPSVRQFFMKGNERPDAS